MGSALIVGLEPAGKGGQAFLVGTVEAGIGPFVEHGADEALGLAVGLGTVGAGHGVAGAEVLAGLAEVAGVGV